MIEISRTAFTELELAGSAIVDRRDVHRATEALEAALADGGRAVLLIDMRAVEDVTMKAFATDAAAGARLLPKLKRLQRVAIVGDSSWLRSLTKLRERVLPGLQVRVFDGDGLEAARTWLRAGASGRSSETQAGAAPEAGAASEGTATDRTASGQPATTPSLEGLVGSVFEAFRAAGREVRTTLDAADGRGAANDGTGVGGLRATDEGGLLTIDLDGRIERADIERVAERLDAPAQGSAQGKVLLLARIARFEGVDPAALLSPALWRLQREGLSRVSRAAIVTSVEWLGRTIESAARLQQVEVRTFAPGDESAARAWLAGAAAA